MKGLLSLDALVAIIIVVSLSAWLLQLVPFNLSQSNSFGSSIQAKAAAISAGIQASAFYVSGLSSVQLEQPSGVLIAKDARFVIAKPRGGPLTADFNGAHATYPAPADVSVEEGVIRR